MILLRDARSLGQSLTLLEMTQGGTSSLITAYDHSMTDSKLAITIQKQLEGMQHDVCLVNKEKASITETSAYNCTTVTKALEQIKQGHKCLTRAGKNPSDSITWICLTRKKSGTGTRVLSEFKIRTIGHVRI